MHACSSWWLLAVKTACCVWTLVQFFFRLAGRKTACCTTYGMYEHDKKILRSQSKTGQQKWLCLTVPLNIRGQLSTNALNCSGLKRITLNSQIGTHTGLFTRGVFLNFFLPQPIIHIARISWFQILKIIITASTTVLSPVALTLKQKIFVNSKILFLQ
jgi:hypothetical protein